MAPPLPPPLGRAPHPAAPDRSLPVRRAAAGAGRAPPRARPPLRSAPLVHVRPGLGRGVPAGGVARANAGAAVPRPHRDHQRGVPGLPAVRGSRARAGPALHGRHRRRSRPRRGDGSRAPGGARSAASDPLPCRGGHSPRGASRWGLGNTRHVPARGLRMSLRRVTVRTAGDAAEPLRARLLELVPDGFEERDDGGVVELAAYVPEREVEAILAAFPGATAEAVEDGWEDAWRTFHRPVVVQGLWLGPPWERPPDPSRTVVIDPGRAF